MQLPLKKILIPFGFAIAVLVIGFAIYTFFFKSPEVAVLPPTSTTTGAVLLPGQLPQIQQLQPGQGSVKSPTVLLGLPDIASLEQPSEVANGGVTKVNKVTDEEVRGVTTGGLGNLVYYDPKTGKFYKKSANGSIELLSDKAFYQVENVTWSSSGDKAVLEYPDGSNIFYDFKSDKQYTLAKELQDFSFSPTSQKLAAQVIGPSKENNWLVTINPDGSDVNFIEQIGNRSDDVQVSWSPNNQVVAMFRDSYDADRQEIVFIGQNKENLKSFVAPGRGFESQWTPQGDKLLYSVYSQKDNFVPRLYLVNAQGDNIGQNNISLNLNTWADKCTIDGEGHNAYCAVPRELPFGSGWYPELADGQPDDFYQIDLATGRFNILAVPNENQSAEQIYLAPDNGTLYFTNSQGNIYSINLPR